ncbi:MAG: response regulator [Nitrospinae bacterium]|nr:response regulator [Nitrospinota bacterium]
MKSSHQLAGEIGSIREIRQPGDFTVLVVDDNEDNVFLLESIISAQGFKVVTAHGGREALDLAIERRLDLDLLITDLMMPGVDGMEVTRALKANPRTRHIPIILLTAKQRERGDVARGLDMGAEDYLTKPIDAMELLARVRSALRQKGLQDELARVNENLAQLIEERTIEVLLTRNAAIFGFAKLAEYRDPETGGHLERIRNYTRALALELSRDPAYAGQVDEEFVATIFESSVLHDIGKVGIPDNVLLKPGKLTPEEFEIMKTHAMIGGDALASSARRIGDDSFLSMGRDIAYFHHERWDGAGYPRGLKGDEIPLAARIMALADVYDALVSKRVYKEAMPHEQARDIILANDGAHFDPAIVRAFRAVENMFVEIRQKFARDE